MLIIWAGSWSFKPGFAVGDGVEMYMYLVMFTSSSVAVRTASFPVFQPQTNSTVVVSRAVFRGVFYTQSFTLTLQDGLLVGKLKTFRNSLMQNMLKRKIWLKFQILPCSSQQGSLNENGKFYFVFLVCQVVLLMWMLINVLRLCGKLNWTQL